ncbi:MAG: DUF2269 domain-containing protein, partial [Actinomycetota bacterium]|nr:DUF2269 domain-containing protein [Actinomycetota bacterium]
ETFRVLGDLAADESAPLGSVRNASPLLHATAALVLLLAANALAVYKPRGVTKYGRKRVVPRPS